jgi:hypothetical protein
MRCAGRALPVRHVGSVDVFLEALGHARPGDVLVVDNGGRLDEACVGDHVTLEVQKAGLHGIVIWGLHRDTDELVNIGLPLFSLGTMATGPQRLDPRPADSMQSARFGHWNITQQDIVACDSDGVLFIPERARHKPIRRISRTSEKIGWCNRRMRFVPGCDPKTSRGEACVGGGIGNLATPRRSPSEWRSMWRAIWVRLMEQKPDYAAPFKRSSISRIIATISALGPASDRQFQLPMLADTIGKALNRLNVSLVSEIQERGMAIPSLSALAGNPA